MPRVDGCAYGLKWCLHKGDRYVDITAWGCQHRHYLCLECSGDRYEERDE